jgi:hypothetical protein
MAKGIIERNFTFRKSLGYVISLPHRINTSKKDKRQNLPDHADLGDLILQEAPKSGWLTLPAPHWDK